MRVAFCVPSLGLQEGQGTVNYELLRQVAAAGHEVDVFTSNVPPEVAALAGVRVRKLPRLPTWQLGNQLMMLAGATLRLRPGAYDLIHADAGVTLHRADVMLCHTLSSRWGELPVEVWHEPGLRGRHATAATRFKARLEVRQFREARAVLANSWRTAEDLAGRGVALERVAVLPFGVDSERFRPPTAAERVAARAAFGIQPDAFVAVFVGAHGPRKGLPQALEALAGAGAGEVLLVVGEHRGGQWKRYAEERALPAVMPGKIVDARRAYWAGDLLVYPSAYDAFGMAVLEAMACGLPVVVSREAGSHEIVRDAGFVLAEQTPRALRSAIDALRTDGARRRSMARRARDIASSRTWDKAGALLLDTYERLAAGPRVRATSAA